MKILKKPGITTAYQAFLVFRFGIFFLISLVFARFLEDKNALAAYEKLNFISSGISFFWVTGLFSAFLTFYRTIEVDERPKLVGEISFFSILFSMCGWILYHFLFYFVYPDVSFELVLPFGLFFLFFSLSHPAEYFIVAEEKPVLLVFWGLVPFAIHFVALVVPLLLGYSLEVSFWFAAASAIVKYFFQSVILGSQAFQFFRSPEIRKKVFQFAIPVGGAALIAGTSSTYLDSILVSKNFSNIEFIFFQYGAREFPLVMLLANGLSAVVSSKIAASPFETNAAILHLKSSSRQLLHIFYILSLALLVFSKPLYSLAFGEEFAAGSAIFDIYLLLVIPRIWFPQTILKGFLQTRILLYSSVGELVLNFAMSVLFMQFWGISGIAFGTVIAFFSERLWLSWYCKKITGISPSQYLPLFEWYVWSVVFVIAFISKLIMFG